MPREKLEYVFCVLDASDLLPLPGGRGSYILYSPTDDLVTAASGRQLVAGTSDAVPGALP